MTQYAELTISDPKAWYLINDLLNDLFSTSIVNTYDEQRKQYKGILNILGVTEKGLKYMKKNKIRME